MTTKEAIRPMLHQQNSYLVPDGIDDGEVTLECRDENSVGRRNRHRPDWGSCDPYATDELIIDAVT